MYLYMCCVRHENRYILERMMHIFWVLAILVLVQFHLLHISSFSYIKCMSDQIIESLENKELNISYALKMVDPGQTESQLGL